MRERAREDYVAPAFMAIVLIGLGETDQAFAALEQAVEDHSWYVSCLKADPHFDPLRSDPRFTALLKKAGLDK